MWLLSGTALSLYNVCVARSPDGLHDAMLNTPTIGSANKNIVVVATNNEVVAALGASFYMLGVQLATMSSCVAIDNNLMIAYKVLSKIEA